MFNVYYDMLTRAKQDAKELVKEAASLEKATSLNTYQGWQDYIDTIEGLFLDDIAHEHADSLDTVIYHGKAIQLCIDTPSNRFAEAEETYLDCNIPSQGLFEMASGIAYWIVYQEVLDALQAEVEGCLEFAESLQNVAWGETEE